MPLTTHSGGVGLFCRVMHADPSVYNPMYRNKGVLSDTILDMRMSELHKVIATKPYPLTPSTFIDRQYAHKMNNLHCKVISTQVAMHRYTCTSWLLCAMLLENKRGFSGLYSKSCKTTARNQIGKQSFLLVRV